MSTEVSAQWSAFIEPFAKAIGLSVEEVTEALKSLVGDPGAEAEELLKNGEYTSFEQLRSAFSSVPMARLKKAVAQHLRCGPKAKAEAAPIVMAPAVAAGPLFEALPPVPEDSAWLEALKAGGDLRVDRTAVVAASRAALGGRVGLFDVPALLVERMESHAEALEEPVGPEFYRLRKLLTQRSYAEIFAALGVEGQFMTQKRKSELLGKLDTILWPTLIGFQGQLRAWTESWQQGLANPAALVGVFAAIAGGGGHAMPPGMMQPPPTDGLRDAADGVIQKINKVFAGTGIPVALALAYDAQRIKEVLDNSTLAAQLGASNREHMLKLLGVAVAPDYVRLERNVTRYLLSVMEYQKVTAGHEELAYLTSLMMLGSQIPWDKLATPSRRSTNVRRSGLVESGSDEEFSERR